MRFLLGRVLRPGDVLAPHLHLYLDEIVIVVLWLDAGAIRCGQFLGLLLLLLEGLDDIGDKKASLMQKLLNRLLNFVVRISLI